MIYKYKKWIKKPLQHVVIGQFLVDSNNPHGFPEILGRDYLFAITNLLVPEENPSSYHVKLPLRRHCDGF